MAWALVKPWKNNEIVRQARTKYDLLKWGIETTVPISKKTVKQFQDGDPITVIYRKQYSQWMKDSTGRLYKGEVEEVQEVTYKLKEFSVVFTS